MDGILRKLMPLFLLSMWGLFYYFYSMEIFGGFYLMVLGISQLMCLVVFFRFVHVFTYAYALSTVLFPALIIIFFQPPPIALLVCALPILYGLRLLYFQLKRVRATTYEPYRVAVIEAHKEMPLFVKVILWLFTSWNYLFYSVPLYFVATQISASVTPSYHWVYLGVVLMVVGLFMETLADAQKQAFKASNDTFCNIGLYQSCRHPNYLGEILFVLGVFISALSVCDHWAQWLAVLVAPLYLIILMIDSARRGDLKQQHSYGQSEAYQRYIREVPSLIPRLR